MIPGTQFTWESASLVPRACLDFCPGLVSLSEIDEIRAQCEANRAWCLGCPDGMVVVELRPQADDLELFIWIAIAWRYGAVQRQIAGIERIARDLGARTVAFQSRRAGWARRLGTLNWHPRPNGEFFKVLNDSG